MKHYQFLEEALAEYEDAIEYYERVQTGLGDTFIREVERVLALTLEFPYMRSPQRHRSLVFAAGSCAGSTSRSITSSPRTRWS